MITSNVDLYNWFIVDSLLFIITSIVYYILAIEQKTKDKNFYLHNIIRTSV